MDKERILRLADAIDGYEIANLGFDMKAFTDDAADGRDPSGHPCGTTACIAGWCVTLFGDGAPIKNDMRDGLHPDQAMAHMLGISYDDAYRIAYPLLGNYWDTHRVWGATPAHAAALLRHYVKTGVVDWDLAMVEGK